VSPVYETDPIGGPDQDSYLNAVVKIETGMPALKVLEHCQRIENLANRVRDERWGPRTLDVDVIMVGSQQSDDPILTLPHPRAHERAFVLVPLRDIEKHLVMPRYGKIADLIANVSTSGVEKFAQSTMIDGTDD
jgi:2-amino-4-hydroxy-6-hydroxymethyldihydropteridine diphosphokinase